MRITFPLVLVVGCTLLTDPDSFEGSVDASGVDAADVGADAEDPCAACPDRCLGSGCVECLTADHCDEGACFNNQCVECFPGGDGTASCPPDESCIANVCVPDGESLCCSGSCEMINDEDGRAYAVAAPMITELPNEAVSISETAHRMVQVVRSPNTPPDQPGWWVVERGVGQYFITDLGTAPQPVSVVFPCVPNGPVLDLDLKNDGALRAAVLLGPSIGDTPSRLVYIEGMSCRDMRDLVTSSAGEPIPSGPTAVLEGTALTVVGRLASDSELFRVDGTSTPLGARVLGLDSVGDLGLVAFGPDRTERFEIFDAAGNPLAQSALGTMINGEPHLTRHPGDVAVGVFFRSGTDLVVDFFDAERSPLNALDTIAASPPTSATGVSDAFSAGLATTDEGIELVLVTPFGDGRTIELEHGFVPFQNVIAVDVAAAPGMVEEQSFIEVAAAVRVSDRPRGDQTTLLRWRMCPLP